MFDIDSSTCSRITDIEKNYTSSSGRLEGRVIITCVKLPGTDDYFDIVGIGIDKATELEGDTVVGQIGLSPSKYEESGNFIESMRAAGII